MKYTAWLIYNKETAEHNKSYINWFFEEANLLDVDIKLMIKEYFAIGIENNTYFIKYKGKEIEYPDFAVIRNIDSLFSKHLEYCNIKTFNSSYISTICNDKAKTHQYLAQHNIPMLDTIFFNTEDFNEISMPFQFPLVLKEVAGHGGHQVYRVTSMKELKSLISKLPSCDVILQKMAEIIGKDVRVFVIGNKVVGAILRSSDVDFRANHSLGGESRIYDLSDNQIELVEKIIKLFDFGMVGIDFLLDANNNFIFNEIEDVVGSRTLSKNSNINIVNIYLTYILSQL